MPITEIPDDLDLATLHDRIKAAKREQAARERAEQGRLRRLRKARRKLQDVEAEIAEVRSDRDVKAEVVATLRERLAEVEKGSEHDPEVRSERAHLVEAISLAVDKGAPVVSGTTCPSNARPYRLLFDLAPHGTNWRTPLAVLGRKVEELTEERDRLQANLEELEDMDTEVTTAA